MIALRARCWGVMSSDVVMDHLVEDRREFVDDVRAQGGGKRSHSSSGRQGMAHRTARPGLTGPLIASCVSLVGMGWPRCRQISGCAAVGARSCGRGRRRRHGRPRAPAR